METLFFAAVEKGKVEAVWVPLKKGVDRSVQREDGVRAMQIARAGEDEQMMNCLLQAKTVMFIDEGPSQEGDGEGDMRRRGSCAVSVETGRFVNLGSAMRTLTAS